MANQIAPFNWFRRYRVRAQDMTDFQQTMLDETHATAEGLARGAVVEGLGVTVDSGMTLSVATGVALSPTGNSLVVTEVTLIEVPEPTAGLAARHLVVCDAELVNEDYITNPTSEFEQVPLRTRITGVARLIEGVESAQPEYPAVTGSAVVLCGVHVQDGATSLVEADLDFEIREQLLKNSDAGQNTYRYDDRLRPFRSDAVTLAIKPSQTFGSKGKTFTYAGKSTPSRFPLDGSSQFSNSDTYLDFETGVISGGDEQSPDFTPPAPSGNDSVVCTVVLNSNDTIEVLSGIGGTRTECLDAITNQRTSGAGGIDLAADKFKICYVLLQFLDDALAGIDVVDARPLGGGGGGANVASVAQILNNQSSPVDVTGFVVDPAQASAFSAEFSINRRHISTGSDGTEDTAFYTNLGTAFGGQASTNWVQADGKILVGGNFTSFNGNTRNYLVRLNADGTEDIAFYTNLGTGFNNAINRVIEQEDGKILVSGIFSSLNGNTRNRLVRLNADGTEDTAFYTNVGTTLNNAVIANLQADGKIILSGTFTSLNGNTRNRLARLNSNGTEDTSFYSNLGTGFDGGTDRVCVQANGQIVVPGNYTDLNGNARTNCVRLNADGTEDAAFYTNLGTSFAGVTLRAVEQADGKIIVGGSFTSFNGNSTARMVRLNSDGTEDTAFTTAIGSGFANIVAGIAIQPVDGKIVVVGGFTTFNGLTRERIVRLELDGTEDTAFYTNMGGITSGGSTVNEVSVQEDGYLVVSGLFTAAYGGTRNRMIRIVGEIPTELLEEGTIRGIYRQFTGEWELTVESYFDDAGLEFSMTAAGQLQYESSNVSGAVEVSEMNYLITQL